MQQCETVAELGRGVQVFKQRYNEQGLASKHDYRTPQQARALLALELAA